MLDFRAKRKKSKLPNYLGSQLQRRLLLLVGLLGLVALLTREAGKPAIWRWMWADPVAVDGVAGNDVDTRLRRSPVAAEALDVVRVEAPADIALRAPDVRKQLLPGVRPEWLATIHDDTVLRGAEHEALYSLLAILAGADEHTLAAASRGPVSYLQLFKQPREYRGELVTLRGAIHQAVYREAAANQQGIKGFYKLVLLPNDHPAGLIFVDCLELPAGFPRGEQVRCEVEVTGLSYKRWAYTARDGIRTAPLLLAKTVIWTDAQAATAAPTMPWTGLAVSVLVAGVACLLVVAWLVRRPTPPLRLNVDGRPGGDVLRQLAALEAAAEHEGPRAHASEAVEQVFDGRTTRDERPN